MKNFTFNFIVSYRGLPILFFSLLSIYKAYSQTPFNYKTYSQQSYSILASNLSDTTESGPLNTFRRMDMYISPKIAGHYDVNVLSKTLGPITCGPNSIIDKYSREIGPNKSSANNPSDNTNGTGPTSFITFDPDDPNLLFTGSWGAGLFYSEDYGATWNNAGTDKQEIVSAAYCVSTKGIGPNKAWFLATGHGHGIGIPAERRSDGVWRTIDKGATWKQIANETDFNAPGWDFQVSKIATDYNNPNILFASTSTGIYKCSNALTASPTWLKVYNAFPALGYSYYCSDVTFQPVLGNPLGVNSNNLFATVSSWDGVSLAGNRIATKADVIFSIDGGSTWQSLPGTSALVAANNYVKANIEISAADPNTVFCYFWGFLGSDYPALYKYDLTLNSYTPVGTILSREGWDFAFAVSNTNINDFVNGAASPAYRSDAFGNPGAITMPNSPHVDHQQFAFSPHTNDIWSSNHGGIYFYDSFTNKWFQKNDGLGTAITADFANSNIDPGKFVTSDDHEGLRTQNGIYHRSDYNESWFLGLAGDGRTAVYDDNKNEFYASRQFEEVYAFNSSTGAFVSDINAPPVYFKGFSNALAYDKLNTYAYDAGFTSNSELNDVYRTNNPGVTAFYKISDFISTHFSGYQGIIPWDIESRGSVIAASLVNSTTYQAHDEFYLMLNNNGNSTITSNIINGWLKVPIPWPTWAITVNSKGLWPTDIDIDEANSNNIIFSNSSLTGWYAAYPEGKLYSILVNSWSGTGSFTVKDITYNLPDVAIGAVKIFNRGAEKYYFVGTNRGIFYTTATILATGTGPTSPVWSCYGISPNVYISSMEVNECAGTLRFSTLGRGVWEIDLPDNVLTADLTINSTVAYTGNIIVPSGKKLTISAAGLLQMSNGSKIIVKKGAKIYVNGGKITGRCNGGWTGIELEGDVTQRQLFSGGFDASHGICEIKNGGTIENAEYGVSNFITDDQGNFNWGATGGVIQVDNGVFNNCNTGVRFISYKNKNGFGNIIRDRSFISRTNFIISPGPIGKVDNKGTGITMFDVKGIPIIGNLFKNPSPSTTAYETNGIGIGAINADFDVSPFCAAVSGTSCAGQIKNRFENLYYGIDASATLPTIGIKINESDFVNNNRGIVLRGTSFSQVLQNNISVGEFFLLGPLLKPVEPYGIYLDGANAYAVLNNTITNAGGTTNANDYGIIASFTGASPNELKQNNFTDLSVGIQAQDNNNGLTLKCNKFTSSTILNEDVMVIGKVSLGSIAATQGICVASNPTTLPGNEFSQTCGSANDLDGSSFSYQVAYNSRASVPVEFPPVGCYNTSAFLLNNCVISGGGQVCPAPVGGGGNTSLTASSLRQEIKTDKQEINQRQNLLDAGNSTPLYTVIASGTENQVRNKLLNKSPYLSDGVLVAFLQHLPVYSDNTIKDIIIANSPVSSKVLPILKGLVLAPDIQNQIKAAQVGVSARSTLINELEYYIAQRSINYNYLLSVLLNDRNNDARFDSLIKNLDYEIKPDAAYLYVATLIEQQDFLKAQGVLDTIHIDSTYLARYNFLTVAMKLGQTLNPFTLVNSDPAVISSINNLRVMVPEQVGINAQILYDFLFKSHYLEKVYSPQKQNQRFSTPKPQATSQAISESVLNIKVYPNPSRGEINFVLDFNTNQKFNIKLFDIQGKLLQNIDSDGISNKGIKTLDVNDFLEGLYFYSVTDDKGRVSNGKFIIAK